MSFKRYPKYRDSGVEWLGEVPEHWSIKKFRYLFRESLEKNDAEIVGDMLSVSGYRGIEIKEYDDDNRRRSESELVGYRVVRVGQLVVNTMWLNYAGLGVSEHEGHVSPAYRAYWISDEIQRRFAHHLLRSSVYVQGYSQLLTGVRPNSLQMSRDDLMEFPVILPPRLEQCEMAAFIDRKAAEIHGLIEEQDRLVGLLREKRRSTISHLITGALDAHVPKRPSGFSWIPDLPTHWEVVAMKRLADVRTGVAKGKDNGSATTVTVPYLRVANVQNGYLDLDEIATMEIPIGDLERYALRRGDVLMNEGGDFDKLGRGCLWDGQIDPCITQNHVFAVRPRAISSRWLSAFIGSDAAQFYFMSRSKQSTNLASISSTNLMELPVVVPRVAEQETILATIADRTRRLDALIAEAERAIELLQERRSALISAAVTGKIDVRGLVSTEAA